MKKLVVSLFLLSALVVSAEDSMTAIDKEVTGVNKEQLEMKEIETKEMLLKGQKLILAQLSYQEKILKINNKK